MGSVQQWAVLHGWDYLVLDDAFLELPPHWVRQRCGSNLYAKTDVARLIWAKEVLSHQYDRVIWVDADVVVFDPDGLARHVNAVHEYGFAHELFLHIEGHHTKPIWGLNNAVMVFDRHTPMLQNYLQRCLERLEHHQGELPRTAIGPTLLNQLNHASDLHQIQGVGLFTPAMLRPFAAGQDALMRLYLSHCLVLPAAANLCHFMRNATIAAQRPAFDRIYSIATERLLHQGLTLTPRRDPDIQHS
jgi:hypothetical protein